MNPIKALATYIEDQLNTSRKATKREVVIKEANRNRSSSSKSLLPSTNKTVIYRSDELPKYSKIFDITDRLSLDNSLKESYVILQSKDNESNLYIVCEESKAGLKVDNDYLQIKKRCVEQGFKVKRLFTTKNIIDITNSNFVSSVSKLKQQDEGVYHQLFDSILKKAVDKGTSDVILSVSNNKARVLMRIKGKVKFDTELPVEKARSLASVAYTSLAESGAKEPTYNERKPQDGIINRVINGMDVTVRLATVPAHPNGFDMTMRIMPLGTAQKEQALTTLGYDELQNNLIDFATTIPVGVFLIAGVTGSGKTTTLGTLIRKILRESNGATRVLTIEDPPEHRIDGATQIPVVRANKDSEETSPFNAAMRASLRSDPDVLMPGEIRDSESAKLLVDATLSGHQVYTTVHAPSMFDILVRLRELGVESSVIGSSSFISCLIYQSLVRKVCPHCAVNYYEYKNSQNKDSPMQATLTRLESTFEEKDLKNIKFRNESGCDKCDFEGISGREVIAEVCVPDRQMKNLFMEGRDEEAIQYYRECGGKFIVDHGKDKLLSGIVDIRDLEEKVGRIDMSDISLNELLKKFDNSKKKAPTSTLAGKKRSEAEVVEIKR